jgi:hypothetical protein
LDEDQQELSKAEKTKESMASERVMLEEQPSQQELVNDLSEEKTRMLRQNNMYVELLILKIKAKTDLLYSYRRK